MNLVIPETLRKQVSRRARKQGISEAQYIHTAIKQTIAAEDDMAEEMQLWEGSSLQDFSRFTRQCSEVK